MDVLETRARDEVPAVVGQRPGTTAPDNRFGRKRPARCHGAAACTRGERRPRHSSSSGYKWRARDLPNKRGARRNRRAPGASSGGTLGCDERSRLEQTGFPPVVGDRQIADCSAANLGTATSRSLSASICVICGFFRCDGGRSSCLRVFVFAMSSVFLSVSLCLCGSGPSRSICRYLKEY